MMSPSPGQQNGPAHQSASDQSNGQTPAPATWDRLQELYFKLSALPESPRAEALAGIEDPKLRAELEALLKADKVPPDFLDRPALGADFSLGAIRAETGETISAAIPEQPSLVGQMMGRYRIEHLIARGGMGEVYRAVRADAELSYTVAIKVVKRGLDTHDILRRFRTERQTLANLNHTNIARLLDGGAAADGRPYLVMEYVEGLPIDTYCRKHGLSIQERLRLFISVCDAVHHAHQSLVVHRDLKPGNILVNADGAVKLLDFGIAKLVDGPGGGGAAMGATIEADRRLTPQYASPEQIEGKAVTTATDIYSLGVILFELLTDHSPYTLETSTPDELRRIVCSKTVPAPSASLTRPPTHAAAGAHRAQHSEGKGDQYPPPPRSADATRRLRRALRGDLDTITLMALRKEPERRYASVEQFSRDISRYLRGLPVMARKDTWGYRTAKFVRRNALLTGTLSAAAICLAALAIIAQLKANEAADQRDAAFLARDQAEEITQFLRTVLTSADPARGGPATTIGDLLAQAEARLDSDLDGRPLVRASVQSAIGTAYVGLGEYKHAEELLTDAYAIRRQHLGDGHHDVAESQYELAVLHYHNGEFQKAEPLLRSALATFIRLRGEENTDVARMLTSLGAVLRSQGKLDEAHQVYTRSLAMQRRIDGEDHLNVAETLNNLAGVHRQQGDLQSAITCLEQALAIRRKRLGNDHMLVAQSVGNLAVMLHASGPERFEEAEQLYRESLENLNRTLPREHAARGITLTNLGLVVRSLGRPEEAEPLLTEALQVREAALPAGDPRTLQTALALAETRISLKQFSEAEALLLRMLAAEPADGPATRFRELLAMLYEAWEKPDEAAKYRIQKDAESIP